MGNHPYDAYYSKLLPALISKVEEFRLLNYETAQTDMLWRFLKEKKWKSMDKERPMSRLVGDILSVKPGEYMNYTQITAYKAPEWNEPMSGEELASLFVPPKGRE
ncbi:post-transcriptional regulator [Domibacillus robiginosus]|uniref:post-transcriptional regulator n=1 Tax=Domibacillus robiginosus TaxID=1071054 RepID=UPI00067B1DBB|nr:post-transcriptional regulator [Domibacillus robiginosus]